TAIVFGISGVVDMALFYPAGKVMDIRGRLWVAIPSMAIMGAGMIALIGATTFTTVSVVAVVLGFGNGIGSGILMTLAADAAPADARSQFMGIWRVFADVGNSGGPLLVAGGAGLGSLGLGVGAIGVISLATVAALWAWVPRWSVHANATTRKQAGLL
ncbi:MAG TPA: MFS transporter, partial [Beutenbergiaceae bacterium]|nr:MFS transporter [Beutenbergiaceae bacterium]